MNYFILFFIINILFCIADNQNIDLEKNYALENKNNLKQLCSRTNSLKRDFFEKFITDNFKEFICGEDVIDCIDRMNFLVKVYEKRLQDNHNNFEFTEDEYSFLKNTLDKYFKEKINFDRKNYDFCLSNGLLFKEVFEKAYKKLFQVKLPVITEDNLYSDKYNSLVLILKNQHDQEKDKKGMQASRFTSDVHSSLMYFAKFNEEMNLSNESFNPLFFGGDLSDRSLFPLFKKQELTRIIDILLNQVHLLNALYVKYCLQYNKKNNIIFLPTLGNHEEIETNFRSDKNIYGSISKELKDYFVWTISTMTNLIPIQITILNENEEKNSIISVSHAVGKQNFYDNVKPAFINKDQGIYCYEVNMLKARLNEKYKQFDLKKFNSFLDQEGVKNKANYLREYKNYLNLLEKNSHITPMMWSDPFSKDFFKLKKENMSSSDAIYFNPGRGFKIESLDIMLTIYKYIEKNNIEKLINGESEIKNKRYEYHSCCGHQHDSSTVEKGFYIYLKKETISLSNFYCKVGSHNRVYFSMCSYCMNIYFLQFKELLDSVKEKYPELLLFLKISFATNNEYIDHQAIGNLLKIEYNGEVNLIDHEAIIEFIKSKIEDKENYALFKKEIDKKKYKKLNDNDSDLYKKLLLL